MEENQFIEIIDEPLPKLTRKEYLVNYYKQNKDKILKENATKLTCPHYKSVVSKQNLTAHKRSNLCKKKKIQLTGKDEMSELKDEIKQLRELIINKQT